jgi:hypothetical protein
MRRSSVLLAITSSACSLIQVGNPPPPKYGAPTSSSGGTGSTGSSHATGSSGSSGGVRSSGMVIPEGMTTVPTTPEGKPLGWTPGHDENVYGPDMNHRKRFVSTKESAAKLGGLPGMACFPSQEKIARDNGLRGACWDPPGGTATLPAAHVQPGMRQMQKANFAGNEPLAIYWFEIPREATMGPYGTAILPSYDRDRPHDYEPYAMQGYARPALPDVTGKSLADALAAFDALDLPFILAVRWSGCEGAHDTVCQMGFDDSPGSAYVSVTLAERIRHRGTDREERELPAGLENKPTDEVVATLKKIGFTNVTVVETDLPCARGIACQLPPPRFYKTTEPIVVHIRRAKPSP